MKHREPVRLTRRFLATWLCVAAASPGLARAAAPPGPDILTENSASQWMGEASGATAAVYDDTSRVRTGSASIRFETQGAFDTWLYAPPGRNADWDVFSAGGPSFWVYAENPNLGFQNNSPWIILGSSASDYATYHANRDWLNEARGKWVQISIPLNGNDDWTRTDTGSPDLAHVSYIEIHGDTWDAGFTLWIDGLGFTTLLAGPEGLMARALNARVDLEWEAVSGIGGTFSHYAVYRSTTPFDTVAGMTPIDTVAGIDNTSYSDTSAVNGTAYYYGVSAVFVGGLETTGVESVGPRTPRDESDLQIVTIARTPRYPRYNPIYTGYSETEPSGFGPYTFSAATGLGGGQSAQTQRWPDVGDPVTYTATIRNRGTNPWVGTLDGTWRVDGAVHSQPSQVVDLDPGETATFAIVRNWDGASADIQFTLDVSDARSGNNALSVDTKSVAFLTYVDVSYVEQFREDSPQFANVSTDDFIDWLNRHMMWFNQLFTDAGSAKRVHYGILEVLDDSAPDPAIDRTPFAIFPFRFYSGDGDLRSGSGYYRSVDDIDYGLLHEMGHQLGIIDLYRLNVPGNLNAVSGLGYSATAGLMNGVSSFVSTHSALAMNHWLDTAHGYYGQYLYRIPAEVRMRFLGFDGQPLDGATVKVYQYCERPGLGQVITDQIKFQGATDANGEYVLPNVAINTSLVPPAYNGDTLGPNPFGYVAVVGTNGVLHFRVEHNGGVDYAWLDITETNVAYEQGQTAGAVFERQLGLGGTVQQVPPADMTELNADEWAAWAQGSSGANTFVEDELIRKVVGESSLKFTTDGGFDTYVRYPYGLNADWDLSPATVLKVRFYAINSNSFQSGSPWIRLKDSDNNYFEYQYYVGGAPYNLLNQALGQWRSYEIPLRASSTVTNGWRRTASGTPDLSHIQFVEIHADTWDYGFQLYLDGVGFDLPDRVPGDLDGDYDVDADDVTLFAACALGPDIPLDAGCGDVDLDEDGDGDQADFAVMQRCISGEGVPADPACAD